MAIEENYSAKDFRKAFEKLLPPGKYWQETQEGSDLDKILDAIGLELKTTHEDVKINLLFEADRSEFGWRIADYQALLDSSGIKGHVEDDRQNPNWIYITVENLEDLWPIFAEIENLRLPHTQIRWIKEGAQGIAASLIGSQMHYLEAKEANYSAGFGFKGILFATNQLTLNTEI